MLNITLIGAGRIAWHLGRRLKAKGFPIRQVISRTPEHAEKLAQTLGCDWSSDWSAINSDTDWLLLAVRDDAIEDVAMVLSAYVPGAFATHTSGATPGAVLSPYFERYGVFYPLQSFSQDRVPVWSKIPFCVDARMEEDLLLLKKIAKTIGNLVYRVDDQQRALLHVAAVFANNFANRCFALAEQILDEKGLPFEMLHPLMEETLAKALHDSPAKMQTGPAMRGDIDTLQRHFKQLENHPEWSNIYRIMSASINPGGFNDE